MPWPHTVPTDLRRRLDEVLSFRNRSAPEVWGVVRDWLEAHQVEMPDSVKVDPPPEGGAQRDQ